MEMKTVEQRILTADKGKYLTDGETCGKTVVLPADADFSVWHEITEEEYAAMMEQQGGEVP